MELTISFSMLALLAGVNIFMFWLIKTVHKNHKEKSATDLKMFEANAEWTGDTNDILQSLVQTFRSKTLDDTDEEKVVGEEEAMQRHLKQFEAFEKSVKK